ncbi:MAG: asparagine synthase (glutamine-hydrolyzing) [Acidobacteriota bacterium]
MCGLCGIVSLEGPLDPRLRLAIGSMTSTIHHRGPDGQGLWTDETAALGHRRLAIIDREGGAQPMTNEDGSCWVVFNGEIYNHRSLRERLLSRGHVFRTTSDTEAILHAYEEFGAACVPMFEGMFAFAIYDTRKRELLIARDRLGKKPLYYAELDGALHFASEIKAIRASPAWDPELDFSQLEGYLSLGYFLAPGTVYRRVHNLPPAHWLRLRDGRIEVRRYWDIEQFDDHPGQRPALERELEDTLRTAVVDRLESEVPLGAFLSGGIDSGLVVSYMAEALGRGVITTTVGFGEAAHNELDAAALTAAQFGTEHHVEIIQPRLAEVLDQIVGAFDEPFADASAIPTFHVAGMSKRHVTVALSGDGGDEAFSGYSQRYVPHALESIARPLLPGAAGRRAAAWLGERWPRSPQLPRALRWGSLIENIARNPEAAYYADLCMVKPEQSRRLLGQAPLRDPAASSVYDAVTAPYRRCPSSSPVQKAEYADLNIYLPNDVLVKVDRMTMQHGLEVRCPLLDHRIIELAFRIPRRQKMPYLRPKYLLRQLAERRLPAGLSRLPKHGFSAPIAEWLAGPCAPEFEADVLQAGAAVHTMIDGAYVRQLFDQHRAGQADHAQALWTVWMLARWCALDAAQRQPVLPLPAVAMQAAR